jgi:hypothetical protein
LEIDRLKPFIDIFAERFGTIDLHGYQVKVLKSDESVSVVIVRSNESAEIEAAIDVSDDTVRLIRLASFSDVDPDFTYTNALDLYNNLLTLLLVCCNSLHVYINPLEALTVTLGKRVQNWRELVIYLCSLSAEGTDSILVQENGQNAIKLYKTVFWLKNNEDSGKNYFITKGVFNSVTPYKDLIELIRAVLTALSSLLQIAGVEVDPFFEPENPDFSLMPPVPAAGAVPPGGAGVPAPLDLTGGGAPPPAPGGESVPMDIEGFPEIEDVPTPLGIGAQ